METMTTKEIFEFLGMKSIFEEYLETGEIPKHWKNTPFEKIDLKLFNPEIRDGKLIIHTSLETIEL